MSDINQARQKSAARRPRRKGAAHILAVNGDQDLARRRALGQFFTPPEVARFMWDMVEHFRGRKLPAAARVIDPACGEGVFLHAAIDRGCDSQLFGADIDESLVPGWRRDPALRPAHLVLANGLVDNPAAGLLAGTFDVVIGNPPFAGAGLKDLLRLLEPRPGRGGGQPDLFGDSPTQPAGTNGVRIPQRQALDRLARELAHYACWRFRGRPGDGPDDPDGPGLFADAQPAAKPKHSDRVDEQLARAILDWPTDRPLDPRRPAVRTAIQRMASTAIEVYFVERFVRLAKPGGMVAMIVPDSVLSSDRLGPLRPWFMENARLLAVVSLPRKVFTGVGANANTGIVFARRYTAAEQQKVDRMPVTSASARLPLGWEKRVVNMMSPRFDLVEWDLYEYLAEVLLRIRKGDVNPPRRK